MYYIIHDVRYNAKVSTEYCILSYLKVLYNIIVTRLHTEFIMLEWILPFMNVQQYNIVTLFFIIDKWILCISVHNKVKKICTVFIIHECILSRKYYSLILYNFFCYSWNFFYYSWTILLFMNFFHYSWFFYDFFLLFMKLQE